MAKFIITVKNKSRIILVKLVTIISVIISSNKGEKSRLKSLLSEGRFFWHLPVKFYRYFRGGGGGVTFGEFTGGGGYREKVVKDGDKSVSTPRE